MEVGRRETEDDASFPSLGFRLPVCLGLIQIKLRPYSAG